jgi:hypothetical protein
MIGICFLIPFISKLSHFLIVSTDLDTWERLGIRLFGFYFQGQKDEQD